MISSLISSFLFAWPEYPDWGYFVSVCVCVCVCICECVCVQRKKSGESNQDRDWLSL